MLLQRMREEVLSYVARAYIKEWVGAGVLRSCLMCLNVLLNDLIDLTCMALHCCYECVDEMSCVTGFVIG